MFQLIFMFAAPSARFDAARTGAALPAAGLVSTPELLNVNVPATGVPAELRSEFGKFIEYCHWFAVELLVNVTETTCELPKESYTCTEVEKVSPVAAAAFRLRLTDRFFVGLGVCKLPTGTVI